MVAYLIGKMLELNLSELFGQFGCGLCATIELIHILKTFYIEGRNFIIERKFKKGGLNTLFSKIFEQMNMFSL